VLVALSNVMLLKVSVSLSELKFVRSVMSCPVEEDPVHGFKHADPNAGSVMAAESASGSRNLDANVFKWALGLLSGILHGRTIPAQTGEPIWNYWRFEIGGNRKGIFLQDNP